MIVQKISAQNTNQNLNQNQKPSFKAQIPVTPKYFWVETSHTVQYEKGSLTPKLILALQRILNKPNSGSDEIRIIKETIPGGKYEDSYFIATLNNKTLLNRLVVGRDDEANFIIDLADAYAPQNNQDMADALINKIIQKKQ